MYTASLVRTLIVFNEVVDYVYRFVSTITIEDIRTGHINVQEIQNKIITNPRKIQEKCSSHYNI